MAPTFNQPPGSWAGAAAPSAGPRGGDAEAAKHRRQAEKAAPATDQPGAAEAVAVGAATEPRHLADAAASPAPGRVTPAA